MSSTLLRTVGLLEGLSFLLLLGVAVPLKYLADNPVLIRPLGMTHGLLFLVFVAVLLTVCHLKKWSTAVFALGILAAVLPFGTFVFDRKIRKLDAA